VPPLPSRLERPWRIATAKRYDLPEIVYVDNFGNAITGLRASAVPADARLEVNGRMLSRRRIFSDVPDGEAFWYENANGLAEVAVNRGRSDQALGIAIGTPVRIRT
jgi:S-adenosylmethionine hydrolase